MKNSFKHSVMWLALILIVLLIFLSVYGAFIGPERAKSFFNSLPLTVYWFAFALILIVAFTFFRRLLRLPGLLLIHAGCVLVLTGAMAGSVKGHKLLAGSKIPEGKMIIFEGQTNNEVIANGQTKQLPFVVKLNDFRIEYYKPGHLHIRTRQGQGWKVPVEIGTEFSLGDDFGTVTVLKVFENFKITVDKNRKVVVDDSRPGYNPALQVQIKYPDGTAEARYVFERFPGHTHPEDKFLLSYRRTISDYISDLEVIADGETVAQKSIEVNRPLYFAGYHFYQHSYDDKAGQYTVLMVVSDNGLTLVYAGYIMLGIGVFWRFWLRHMPMKSKSK